jgi:hypothetical protein
MAAVGACSVLAYTAQSQTNNLYNDTTGNQGVNYNYTGQAGNEVVLAGSATSDLITYFAFQFDLAGSAPAPAGAAINVTFYQNNGYNVPTGPGGYPSPSSVLFSQSYSIAGLGITSASQLQLDQTDLGGGVTVPQDFTWTVSFTGLGGDTAGLALYNPPTTGTNYGDAWYNPDSSDTPGSTWQLQASYTDTGTTPPTTYPMEFGAEFGSSVTTVPDSSCLPVSVLAVMAGFGWMKRFQRRKV